MFSAFLNIVRIPDLRKKVLFTLGVLIVYRMGVFIPLPGLNLEAIQAGLGHTDDAFGRFINLMDMFAGGGLKKVSIFALGIMPYISASIIFQLLTFVVPAIQRVAKEGESGRRRINQWTRYTTIGLCIIQAFMICGALQNDEQNNIRRVMEPGMFFLLQSALILTTGTAFLMWLGDQIDEFGIGNGMSVIIMIGITSRLPAAIHDIANNFDPAIESSTGAAVGPSQLVALGVMFLAMIAAVVFVTEATRRIPMQTPKRTKMGFRQPHYLPLKLTVSGVIPIIFADALLMVPNFLTTFQNPTLQELLSYFQRGAFVYITVYVLLIVFFCYFYTVVVFDPKEHAENFKQYGMFIPGIRPGPDTRHYLEKVMNRITLAGAVFIAVIAIVPQIIQDWLHVSSQASGFFGGTGLLIVVGVALDMLNRIESHLIMERYEGFLKSGGRIRGRKGG